MSVSLIQVSLNHSHHTLFTFIVIDNLYWWHFSNVGWFYILYLNSHLQLFASDGLYLGSQPMGGLGNDLKVVVNFVLGEGDRQDIQLYHCLVSLAPTPTNIPADSKIPYTLVFGGWGGYRPLSLVSLTLLFRLCTLLLSLGVLCSWALPPWSCLTSLQPSGSVQPYSL